MAVLVEPEVLVRQADFDIGRAPVVLGVDRGRLCVDWLAGRTLFGGEQLQEVLRLGLLVDAPAVVALRDLDVAAPRRVEGTRCVGRVVLLGEFLDKGLGLLLVDGDAAVLLFLQPREDAVTIEDLALVAELVGDRDAC